MFGSDRLQVFERIGLVALLVGGFDQLINGEIGVGWGVAGGFDIQTERRRRVEGERLVVVFVAVAQRSEMEVKESQNIVQKL